MYYETKEELIKDSLEQKIDKLLQIGKTDCEEFLERYSKQKDEDFSIDDCKERNLEIGALVRGEAFYHELDEYYEVIGFLVKSETTFHGKRNTDYGFRGIYFDKCSRTAPINFDEGYDLEPRGQIGNGLGDHIEILDVLVSEDDVAKCINENNIDINKHLKKSNMYLEPKERELEV